MPVLAWRNDADGFAFVNSWNLDPVETASLTGLAQPAVWSAVATIAAVLPFPDPFLLTAVGVAANLTIGAVAPTVGIGLCGGMAYASLDYWHARAPLPRGAHAGDQPMRGMLAGMALRDFIWARLLNSLGQGGALNRTLEWSLLLNQIPSPIGGASALRNRTVLEWNRVKSSIDAGVPCPIGLVYTGRNVWDQHQILVYGYEDAGNGTGTMYVYDSNFPKQYGDTSHSTVALDFTGTSLAATSPSDFGNTLAGFFCTFYTPVPPPPGLATSFGQFVRWPGDPSSYVTAYGARMPIADAAELAALGASTGDVRGATAAPTSTPRPRDNALLRERSSAPVFLYQGGSPFQVPDPTWLDRFGGSGAVRVVSDGSLPAFAGLPAEGTLLREWSAPEVFRIMGGQRRWVPNPTELDKYGGFPTVRIVPDGALAAIPQGPPTITIPSSPDSRQVFNADFYLSHYSDLAAAFGGDTAAAVDHWLNQGLPNEGRRGSREFDVQFYLNRYADLSAAFGTNYAAAVDHWLNQGLPNEGRRGSREFDVQFYLNRYGDLRNAFGTNFVAAFNHWLNQGLPNEGRRGSREFDVQFYLNRYADLSAAFGTNYTAAVDHWLNQGLPNEGRRGSREFDVQFYLNRYADLSAAFGTNYAAAVDHWLNQGLPNEGRAGAAEVDVRLLPQQIQRLTGGVRH